MENTNKVNKIKNIEKIQVNLKFNDQTDKDDTKSNSEEFLNEFLNETGKYKGKMNKLKEKEMLCAIDLLKDDFTLEEVIEIFEFTYEEFYDYLHKKLKQTDKESYHYIINKIRKERFERVRHK